MSVDWSQVRFFKREEFDSKDKDGSGKGTGDNMQPRLVFMLDALRGILNTRLSINSGYRTEKHNAYEGGAPKSAHLTGEAVDIGTRGWTYEQKRDLVIYARKLGFTGVGVAANFIHLDMKTRVAAWRYTSSGQVSIPIREEYKWL